jgi:hypothetical protein
MPARGDRLAPRFDSDNPRDLKRYFDDLEFLFQRSNVTDPTEQKKHAIRFLKIDESELWMSRPGYTPPTTTYEDFKKQVIALYPGADEERKYTRADMTALMGERVNLGVNHLGELGEYFRSFLQITTYLVGKNRISESEQSRAFLNGFQAPMHDKIMTRLQVKFPDHILDDPYKLADIYDAAHFVLRGTPAMGERHRPAAVQPVQAPPDVASQASIKREDLTTIVEAVAQTFAKLMAQAQPAQLPPQINRRNQADVICNGCGEPGHFNRNCTTLNEAIARGLCKRDANNRIVLPNGYEIPRNIPGTNILERVIEWHKRNPGTNNGAMFFETTEAPPAQENFTLTTEERIRSLRHEINALQTRGQTQAQKSRPKPYVEIPVPPRRQQPPHMRQQAPPAVPPAATNNRDTTPTPPLPQQAAPVPAPGPVQQEADDGPIHPFAPSRNPAYAPPRDRNAGAPPAKKQAPATRNTAPIHSNKVAEEVYKRAMATEIVVTQEELLSLSPEVRNQVREAVSNRRQPNVTTANMYDQDLQFTEDDIPSVSGFLSNVTQDGQELPPDAFVISDPYETYIQSLPKGSTPKPLIVAKDTHALRTIRPSINNSGNAECILDPGCQVIAMSEEVSDRLGLIYDPDFVTHMMSANGSVNSSLGLARNVAFRFGTITVYLQIHILRDPAYEVLLGRPFDVLTESIVRNYRDERQTITIHDPNTGERVSIPTHARKPRSSAPTRIEEVPDEEEGFYDSRN